MENKLEKINDYLLGRNFSGGLKIKVAQVEETVIYRIPFLLDKIKQKKIIHLGCVDHVPLIENKISNDDFLHFLLMENAQRCLGIDINSNGIEFLQKKGVTDLYCIDIESDAIPFEILKESWDFMIVGEILEHTDNPVRFLECLKNKFGNCVKSFIITVPNAYTYMNMISLINNLEIINSDHRFWFTPYTLAKVCTRAGFQITDFHFARKSKINSLFPFKRMLFQRLPIIRDTIIMIISSE